MASEALRMIINLEVDESLRSNYKTYQQQPHQTQSDSNNNNDNNDNIFPQQIKMFPWNDIQQITQYIYEQTQIPTEHQRLFFRGREITAYHRHKLQRSSNRSTPRNNHKRRKKLSSPTLAFFGITHESTIYLQCKSANDEIPIVPYGYCSVLLNQTKTSNHNKLLIEQCINGLYDDMRPILSSDGEGGTYFLRNSNNEKIACFKPSDEEAGCINNPRGRTDTQQAMHCGIKPSEGHLREIAAYLIDNNPKYQKISGFHNVPPTMRVEIAYNGFHYNSAAKPSKSSSALLAAASTSSIASIDYEPLSPKIGALQKFIKGELIENYGPKNFAIREVHKIGILDIRILNCDRNSGNVLVSKDEFNGRYELIPIDHGLSLPEKIEITRDSWVWLNWDQSKQPFDPYTIEYINNIDIEYDIQHLKSELNFPPITFENMRISNLVLKKGANKGLTLHEIGSIIARPDFDTKSILEELMLQAEILAIEKCRQNKHLINRIKLKRRKSIEKNTINNNNTPKQLQHPTHIVQKFIDKGIPLKTPLLPRSNTHTPNAMVYVPSLAPPNSRQDLNGVASKSFQVLNTSNHHPNSTMIFPGSPVIPLSSTNSMKLSPNPSKLATSTSLGSGALSITPEPFALYHPSSSNHKPKALIVHKINVTESNPSTDDIDADDTSLVMPFWTPNYRAQSSMSQQSSNSNLYPRSATPDRRNRNKSPQMPPFMLHPETPPAPKPIHILTKARKTADEAHPVSTLSVDVALQKHSESDSSQQSNKESADQNDVLYSPLQIQFMEKTSSIHDRDGSTILNDKGHTTNLNTIFKSISAATNDSAESDSLNDVAIGCEIEEDEDEDGTLLFSKIQPQLQLNDDDDDDDDDEREQENEENEKTKLVHPEFNRTPLGLQIHETEDNYDRLYENKPKPFSSLNIDTMTSNTTISTKAMTSKSSSNSNTNTAEMVALSRSTSCIDVRKNDVRKSSTFSLNAVDSSKNLMSSTTNTTSNPLQTQGVSMDDDTIFLYNTDEIKSASLINHSSMLEKRKEMLALRRDDSNSSGGSADHKENDTKNPSRSFSEMSVPTSVLTSFVLEQKMTTDSPSNSNQILNIINNKSGTNSNHSVHTPSNTSQDDMIRPKDHGFVIHPIMERMAKENQEVKKWFMYYLDQLLGIQCERILNRSRKNDNRDNIYDIDTVHGSFIWKNELRKHWVRSRLERKRLMAQLPPKNPWVDSIQFVNKDEDKGQKKSKLVKPKLVNAKTNPVRSVSQNPFMNDELFDDDDDEDDDFNYHDHEHDDDEESEEDDKYVDIIENQETINYIDLKKKSDEEEINLWFGMERPEIDTDQED